MPIVEIQMFEGRTLEQKRALVENVTRAVEESIGADRNTIRVLIHEMKKENWGIGGRLKYDM